MRIVLLGAPGSGKGTQAKLIAEAYKLPHVPMNDLLRAAVAGDTPFGRQVKLATEMGQPVADEVMLGIVQEHLSRQDAEAGFILDGFPRNLSQGEALGAMLERSGRPLQAVVLIDVDFETLLQRFTGRRTCVSCSKTYNIYTSPSRLDDRCDECGGNLRHRADEREETISSRLRVYETQTAPLIEYYRGKGLLRVVPGAGEIDEIFAEIRKVLDALDLKEMAAAGKPAAPAKRGAKAGAAALTRAAKKIVRVAEKEARSVTKAVHTLKKKALRTTRELLEKAEKAVETKRRAKSAVKPPAAKKAPPARKIATKAGTKKVVVKKAVVKKVAVKKIAAKAVPKKLLKSTIAKKGAVRKAAAGKKTVPPKTTQKRR